LAESCDHAAAATTGFRTAIAGYVVFNRAAVTHQDKRAFGENVLAKRVEIGWFSHDADLSGPL